MLRNCCLFVYLLIKNQYSTDISPTTAIPFAFLDNTTNSKSLDKILDNRFSPSIGKYISNCSEFEIGDSEFLLKSVVYYMPHQHEETQEN